MPAPTFDVIDFPYQPDAESLFARIRQLPDPVWLDSGKPRSLQGRFDIISAAPTKILESHNGRNTLTDSNGVQSKSTDTPFALAEALWQELEPAPPALNSLPFSGGLLGYWGYTLGTALHRIPPASETRCNLPDLRLGVYTWALVLNHSTAKAQLIFHPQCAPGQRRDIRLLLEGSGPEHNCPEHNHITDSFTLTSAFAPTSSQADHIRSVERIKDYIRAGDCYQVNLAQHFSAGYTGDTWHAYQQLRRALPSPFSAYLEWQGNAVMSLSPERFLKSSMGQVETKPIKGTMKRGETVEADNNNAVELINSAKNRAENLMIVDLLRNDLGKSCEPGSIRVPKLFALESFANVHHLVSTITGTLAKGESPFSLLEGAFPGGSITGAPKKRAMEIIEELEGCQRSLYCGSVGYVSTTGRMDTNIAIRTLLADGNALHCWGGGGIVAESDPQAEYQESLDKIQLLMDCLQSL
jgi:para-aminobenzoate synthetase component 1